MDQITAQEVAIGKRLTKAERAIQNELLSLAEDTMREIDHVSVDTRNFANLAVDISFKEL